jgi:glucans biosynthesis protein
MPDFSRRHMLGALALGFAPFGSSKAGAQEAAPAASANAPVLASFNYDDVVKRARELASVPFDNRPPALPDAVAKLDFDAWRDIRFRPEKALLGNLGGPFRLETFHLGHLFKTPVTINTIRDGIATPIPYSASLFDYGHNKFDKPLPVNLGFAGFRLHYPLNEPQVYDEVIAFLGASYFRFLGRGQHYGISARALTIGAGTDAEEFPFFREFWVVTPEAGADHATIYALVDGQSTTGAFHFDLYPGMESFVEVGATLFPRRPIPKLGLGPLTSMFFIGENDKRFFSDFRPELHDSDGLLMRSSTGEQIWRPLRNPVRAETSAFLDKNIRGYGLLQRDRVFEHYQDLDLDYELRPSYWVEPHGDWGDGRIELIELPTPDEANDNIVAAWVPKDPVMPEKPLTFGYRITALLQTAQLSPGGWSVNTFRTQAHALGSTEPPAPGAQRFIIDFTGGDLSYYAADPGVVEVVPTTTRGKILRSFIVPNPHVQGFRAAIDLQLGPGEATDLRAFLRAGNRTLTETWTFPWRAQ